MNRYIILYACGTGEDQKLGRMTVKASGKLETEKAFRKDNKNCEVEGILTEKQYQRIF